jgi:hypothetical protein
MRKITPPQAHLGQKIDQLQYPIHTPNIKTWLNIPKCAGIWRVIIFLSVIIAHFWSKSLINTRSCEIGCTVANIPQCDLILPGGRRTFLVKWGKNMDAAKTLDQRSGLT